MTDEQFRQNVAQLFIEHRKNVLEECGDLLFYIQALLIETGFTLESAMKHNIDKLAKRYPQGYTDAAAIARADKEQA